MQTVQNHQTIILYDGWCSLCTNAANKITKLDTLHNGIDNQQIKAIDFRKDPTHIEHHHLDPAQIRKVLHAITPEGQVLTAMDALRHAMKQVGRNKSIAWTALPIIRPICDRLYLNFAKNRLRWFGKSACTNGSCAIPDTSQHSDTPKQ